MVDSLVILAAGMSSRMKKSISEDNSLTDEEKREANERTKGLISIDKSGRPLLDYILYNAKRAGVLRVYIVTGEDNVLFKSFYGEKSSHNFYNGLEINYAIQYIPNHRNKPFGTADAVYQTLEQYPELKQCRFIVCNSDNLYSQKAFKLLVNSNSFQNSLIAYNRESLKFSSERIARFAILSLNDNGYLEDIIEKPSQERIEHLRDASGKQRVSMNIFKFDGKMFFSYLENCPINKERDEKELPTALMNMVRDYSNTVGGIPLSEHVPDLTSKEDIPILKEHVENINLSNW